MRLLLKLIKITLLLGITAQGFAQSSDIIKYHIVFDVSGSTKIVDRYDNLENFLKELINEEGRKVHSVAIFDIYFFGDPQISTFRKRSYKLEDLQKLIQDGKDSVIFYFNENKKRRSIYSHIDSPLDSILSKFRKDKENRHSAGVFIFTDGKLENCDIDTGTFSGLYGDYLIHVDTLLQAVRSFAPVFLVQTSSCPANPYFTMKSSTFTEPFKNCPDQLMGDDFFWLKNTVKFDRSIENEVKKSFQDFTAGVNDKIISGLQVTSTTTIEDSVETAILVQQLLLAKHMDSSKIPAEIKEVIEYINESSLSREDVKFISEKLHDTSFHKDLSNFTRSQAFEKDAISRRLNAAQRAPEKNIMISREDVKSHQSSLEKDLILGFTDFVIERAKEEAIFALMEKMNHELLSSYPEIKQYVFPETAKLLQNQHTFSLALVKESFQRDIDRLPDNIVKYTGYRSAGVVALWYFKELRKSLIDRGSLEYAARTIVEKRLHIEDSISTKEAKFTGKAILFTAKLISYLADKDIAPLYDNSTDNTYDALSSLLAILALNGEVEFDTLRLSEVQEPLKKLYRDYVLLKNQISEWDSLKTQLPKGDYEAYRKFHHDILLDVLWRSADLFLSGFELYNALYKENKPLMDEAMVNNLRDLAREGVEFYFLIEEHDYKQAALLGLDMLIKTFVVDEFPTRPNGDLKMSFDKRALKKSLNSLKPKKIIRHYKSLKKGSRKSKNMSKRENRKNRVNNAYNASRDDFTYSDREFTRISNLLKQAKDTLNTRDRKCSKLKKDQKQNKENKIINNSTPYLALWKDTVIEDFNNREFSFLIPLFETKNDTFVMDTARFNSFVRASVNILASDLPISQGKLFMYDSLYKNSDSLLYSFRDTSNLRKSLTKMFHLTAELSAASSSEEVKSVISNYALSVASYRIKRNSPHTLMLNAYAGLAGTYYPGTGDWAPAISGPIGLEYSWQWGEKKYDFSLMANIVDIGNVIDYRLFDKGTDDVATFENIFAPGLYIVKGIGKTWPLSIGLGYQLNPGRASLFIGFDLPLYNFWTDN